MGAHYRSIQIRSTNRDVVLAALERFVQASKARVLVGPELSGWIGVYLSDEASGSDDCAAALAKQCDTSVLDLMVHHSDVFFYRLFRGAEFVDEYCSDPDHFEEVDAAEHERLKGKPEVFRDFLSGDKQLAQLKSLLAASHDGEFLFEENRLEKFAALLGIKNSLSSYEYLTRGESHGIEGRKQFIHFPDLTAEKAAKKAAAANLRAETKKLKQDGILCFESLPPGKGTHMQGCATFDPLRGGILFKWGYPAAGSNGSNLFWIKPPWTGEPEPVELIPNLPIEGDPIFSQSGKWFAGSDKQLRVWNWPERKLVEGVSANGLPVHFSPDEKLLLYQTRQGFEVFSLETKTSLLKVAANPHFLAWHPSGKFILTKPRQDQIAIIDLELGRQIKVLYSGEVTDHSALAPIFSGTLKQAGISDDQLADWSQGFIRGSDEPFSLKFSLDGSLLFCATTRGLRVLDWDKVLAAERATPSPRFSASPAPLESPLKPSEARDYINFIYDVVLDQSRNRLLFCGVEGALRYFNLADSKTGVLFKPPGASSIWRLQLSPDREFICCFCTPSIDDRNKKSNSIRVWNYQRLCAAAGLDW